MEKTNSAAVLMRLLGEDLAASIMSHLDEHEVRQLLSAMPSVDGFGAERIDRLEELLDGRQVELDYPPIS